MVHCTIKYKGKKKSGGGARWENPHELIGLQQPRAALRNAAMAHAQLSAYRLSGGTNGLWFEDYATYN